MVNADVNANDKDLIVRDRKNKQTLLSDGTVQKLNETLVFIRDV